MKITTIFFMALLLLVAGCASNQQSATGAAAAEWNGEVKEFTVRAFQFGYEPSVIEVNKGDKVKISAYTSDVPHGLAIPGYGINMRLLNSNPVTEEFIADRAGQYTFYCNVPCGSGHGAMRGTLNVKG